MGGTLKILTKLGFDTTFFYQFAILIILFFLIKKILINKLLATVEERERKTYKLSKIADEKLFLSF